jgi:Rrf2 family protein
LESLIETEVSYWSQTTGYAIEALACLARRRPQSMLVREIAGLTEIPPPYLAKIIQRLAEAGIVVSKRGYKGGVRLTAPPEKITLLQIDAAADSGRSYDAAVDSARPDSFWEAFHQSYREQLASMTLADVLAYEHETRHALS